MWKNKHVVVAMLIAPILAILAWFAVDYLVAERPHAAKRGAAYPLAAKSNCRYESGQCDLENEDVEISIKPLAYSASQVSLQLTSRVPLQQATVGLAERGGELAPVRMSSGNADNTEWGALIPVPANDDSVLRVAIIANDTTFFAEVPVVFLVSGK